MSWKHGGHRSRIYLVYDTDVHMLEDPPPTHTHTHLPLCPCILHHFRNVTAHIVWFSHTKLLMPTHSVQNWARSESTPHTHSWAPESLVVKASVSSVSSISAAECLAQHEKYISFMDPCIPRRQSQPIEAGNYIPAALKDRRQQLDCITPWMTLTHLFATFPGQKSMSMCKRAMDATIRCHGESWRFTRTISHTNPQPLLPIHLRLPWRETLGAVCVLGKCHPQGKGFCFAIPFWEGIIFCYILEARVGSATLSSVIALHF